MSWYSSGEFSICTSGVSTPSSLTVSVVVPSLISTVSPSTTSVTVEFAVSCFCSSVVVQPLAVIRIRMLSVSCSSSS